MLFGGHIFEDLYLEKIHIVVVEMMIENVNVLHKKIEVWKMQILVEIKISQKKLKVELVKLFRQLSCQL